MASGLVPITNRIAALPEFVDDECGYLCVPDNALALAEAIEDCISNPELFLSRSENAAIRSSQQCGFDNTLAREIEFLV